MTQPVQPAQPASTNKYVLVIVDFNDGHTFIGPFDSYDQAIEYADCQEYTMHVIELHQPNEAQLEFIKAALGQDSRHDWSDDIQPSSSSPLVNSFDNDSDAGIGCKATDGFSTFTFKGYDKIKDALTHHMEPAEHEKFFQTLQWKPRLMVVVMHYVKVHEISIWPALEPRNDMMPLKALILDNELPTFQQVNRPDLLQADHYERTAEKEQDRMNKLQSEKERERISRLQETLQVTKEQQGIKD